MSAKFKFKYLDSDYIKRLQLSVNKNVSNEIKERPTSGKSDIQSQTINQNKSDCSNKRPEHSAVESDEERIGETATNDITTFKTKITSIESTSQKTITVPKLKLKTINSPVASGVTRKTPTKQKQTTPPHAQSIRQYDDIETTLSKITSAQRAICTIIDSLMPNLMQKRSFDTPLDAHKCRKRFDEFLKMFTRNYLYPIDLMMTEIQSNKIFAAEVYVAKVYSLYNILQIATSTYVNNVRNHLDHTIPPKIEDLLNSVRETTLICVERSLFDSDDYVVQLVLDKVDDVLVELQNIPFSRPTSRTTKPKPKPVIKPNLQMYRRYSTITPTASFRPKLLPRIRKIKHVVSHEHIFDDLNRSNQQQQQQRQQQQRQPAKSSRCYDIMLNTSKHMTRPAFGSKDKIIDGKCEFNNNSEFGDAETTVSHHALRNKRSVVSAKNSTASGLMVEKELFISKNAKYSHVISMKDEKIPELACDKSETGQANPIDIETRQKLATPKQSSTNRNPTDKLATDSRVNILKYQKYGDSKKLLSRLSEELNAAPLEKFHKNLDFGERLFIEKFLALEMSI